MREECIHAHVLGELRTGENLWNQGCKTMEVEATYSSSVTCAPLGGLPHVFALFMTQPSVAWGQGFFPWDGCLTLCSGGILFITGTAIQDFVFSSLFSLWPQALLTVHYSNPPLKTTSFCFLMGFSIALMTIVSKCLVKINSSIFATAPRRQVGIFFILQMLNRKHKPCLYNHGCSLLSS